MTTPKMIAQTMIQHVGTKHSHPEDWCQKCGARNPTWYADNELFNKINGSPTGIICPVCFENMCDAVGIAVIYKVEIISQKRKENDHTQDTDRGRSKQNRAGK